MEQYVIINEADFLNYCGAKACRVSNSHQFSFAEQLLFLVCILSFPSASAVIPRRNASWFHNSQPRHFCKSALLSKTFSRKVLSLWDSQMLSHLVRAVAFYLPYKLHLADKSYIWQEQMPDLWIIFLTEILKKEYLIL